MVTVVDKGVGRRGRAPGKLPGPNRPGKRVLRGIRRFISQYSTGTFKQGIV